jgi:UDP-2-acetamido-2-deoxy-ribo-hexuluronate aminotransferase
MRIDFANLQLQYQKYKADIDARMQKVLDNSNYIMGSEVEELESALATFTGAPYALTCASGTDALILALMALDIKAGDEVITTPFTFIATAEAIALLGATPVFVDINEQDYTIDVTQIEAKITPKTKAIMPVSLYGQIADMDAINTLAQKYSLYVIEDGAQSFGASYQGKRSGNVSAIGTTSFFPAKPLGCYGDGGAVFVNDEALYTKLTQLRNHGQDRRYNHKYIGVNGRMDTIQCAVVLAKLPYYEEELLLRDKVAQRYTELLSDKVLTPQIMPERTSAWAQYSIRVQNRETLQEKLQSKGIPTAVHYPKPLHMQECFAYLGYTKGDFKVAEKISQEIMSLPMNPFLSEQEIAYICTNI